MRSRHHFPLSLLAGAACLPLLDPRAPALAVGYAGLLGTLIDLDHFLIARWRTGTWEPLWRCLRNPRIALLEQHRIFPEGAVGSRERLATHAAAAVGLVGLLAAPAPGWAALSAAVLAVHVLADVAWDRWRAGRKPSESPA